MSEVKIILVDDHTILRDGLKRIIEQNDDWIVIDEASDGVEGIQKIINQRPDLAIIDLSLPLIFGTEVVKRVSKEAPNTKIIVLTKHDDLLFLEDLKKHNLDGFVLKDEAANDLTRAITEVLKGNFYLAPKMAAKIIGKGKGKKGASVNLSARERDVLKLIAEGKNSNEIAKVLCISPTTVKVHRKNMYAKLEVNSIADLVKLAIRMKLIDFDTISNE